MGSAEIAAMLTKIIYQRGVIWEFFLEKLNPAMILKN